MAGVDAILEADDQRAVLSDVQIPLDEIDLLNIRTVPVERNGSSNGVKPFAAVPPRGSQR